MTQPGSRTESKGFLLLLLCLFIFYLVFADKNKGIESIELLSETGSEYPFNKDDITAHQKVTLGILIDINSESSDGLTAIPGVGNSIALAITEERKKRNGFSDINELKTIPGIGEKLFKRISPYVRL